MVTLGTPASLHRGTKHLKECLYIVTRNGPVCSNLSYPYTFSTAWVMVQDAGLGNHYAQSGYI